MLVCEHPSTSTSSSSRHQDYAYQAVAPPSQAPHQQQQQQQQQQLDLALEGRSILLQQRAPSHPCTPHPCSPAPAHPPQRASPADNKTFSPLQLQLRIDLHSEQGVDVPGRLCKDAPPAPSAAPLTRRQRAQLRRRQEQQKPTDEVVYQRRTPSRPRTPATCPRTPLAMSTMSMPAAGQKFATDDAAANVFGSAEETSAAVKRLLAKSGTNVMEEHRVISSTSSKTTSASSTMDYLQDSFDFLHQRHMKNLSAVISRHQQQQQQQAPGQEEQLSGQSQTQTSSQRLKKQVHIHQSAFYDGQSGLGLSDVNNMQQPSTFKSTKTINLSNNNSSNSSTSDLEDAKMLQQQQIQQQQQQRRCVRENSTSSLQSQSSVSSSHSNSFDNFNNNFCDAMSLSNKSNTTKQVSSKSSTTSSTSSSSSTSVQQSFSSSKKQIIKQSFSSSSVDFDDRMGIDVMLTPSGMTSTPGTPTGVVALSSPNLDLAASNTKSKVKQTTKVTSSVMSSSSSSGTDQPEECKQSVKTFKAKTVKKSVSDGRQVHTDVNKHTETAEEEAEGSLDKPVITFSHVSSEGSHQSFTDDIVRFDSSALSSPSRSRSPSPMLEMPAPYNDLSKEIKRPPMEKA
ncbi:uncharacterized protein DDB_G0271670-like [Frankliniella occidentalis]|uniref:Uncharacterized protein DDB_G0271670-like n=1 Tax=Frankliniella occidentalis TaxID=133901 RepID=A0A6J1SRS9_FRAOC|nr:uncharacterized protein DDB_G0271670-like [Frankliniella occidentalis]